MDGEKVENNQPPVVSNPPPYAYYSTEDEINLADLWRVLVERKSTLFGVTAAVTLGALLYSTAGYSRLQSRGGLYAANPQRYSGA